MLISYNDDAATHDDAKIMTLCGFLAEADGWEKLDQLWQPILNKPSWPYRIAAFHTVDCANQAKAFRDWPYPERLAMFGDLITAICACKVRAIGAGVIVEDFNALPNSDLDLLTAEKMGTPQDFLFHLLMQQIVHPQL